MLFLDEDEGDWLMRNKVVALDELGGLVRDGETVALGGAWYSNHPMAAVRQLIRAGRKDLHAMTIVGSVDVDLLAGAGVISHLSFSMVTLEAFGLAPNVRRGVEGGSLGWRQADRLPALYSDAASKLQSGQISEVLRSANGFHIVRLIDKRQGEQKAVVEQNKARHILVRVNDLVSESEAKAKIERLRDRISGGAKFEDVAKLGSEDGSAQKGGELGWVSPGDTVPEFEAAMTKAALNTVVGPVRTQFGYHLLEVTERRSQDVTRERTRQSARVALRDRKADEAFQTWLREQRDRATVEIKLNDI